MLDVTQGACRAHQLSIDDDILAIARARAEREGRSIGEVVSDLARKGLSPRPGAEPSQWHPPEAGSEVATMTTLGLVSRLRDDLHEPRGQDAGSPTITPTAAAMTPYSCSMSTCCWPCLIGAQPPCAGTRVVRQPRPSLGQLRDYAQWRAAPWPHRLQQPAGNRSANRRSAGRSVHPSRPSFLARRPEPADFSAARPDRLATPNQITDTWLLALAADHGGRLVTFDRRLASNAIDGGAQALEVIGGRD